jgi:predicted permease
MSLWSRIRNVIQPQPHQDEIREELDFHMEMDRVNGHDFREARLRLGNPRRIEEEVREMGIAGALDTTMRALQQMLRALRRNPTFAAATLLTLALAIGANTAVFSVVNSLLLKPLPYPKAEELVSIQHSAPGAPGLVSASGDLRLSASMFFTYADHNRSFQSIGAWGQGFTTITGLGEPEELPAIAVTDGVFQALQVQPIAGRWLSAEDQKPSAPRAVVLSYGYWQRRFGGSPSTIGRTITLSARPAQIVGVMPPGFRIVDTDAELFIPYAFDRAQLILPGFGYRSLARLRPGVSIARASTDISRMIPIWMDSWPAPPGVSPKNWERWKIAPAIRPLDQDVVGSVRGILWVVMGATGIVLLIACANIANLLLVRADARQQELAVRAAIGAGWGRIARELLLESVGLGVLGGMLGLGLAYAALQFLIELAPAGLPRLNEIGLDAHAFGFNFGLSILAGLLFGLIPAIKYTRPHIAGALGASGRSASPTRERHLARNILVVSQVALALVLLVSSGLMIRSAKQLQSVDPGYTHPEQVQTLRIAISPAMIPEPDRVVRTQHQIVDKLAAVPGVMSVAYSTALPNDGFPPMWDSVQAEHTSIPRESEPMRRWKYVSPGFLATMGTRLIAGRDYAWSDESRPVVLVSENFAKEVWGSASAAIGKRVGRPDSLREVIGVAQDVHEDGADKPAPATVLWPAFGQSPYGNGVLNASRNVTFTIRTTRAGSESLLKEIQQAVWSVNSSLPVAGLQTMADLHQKALARTSFTMVMLSVAGIMALTLGMIGIYGVIAYAVAQQRREIGIRMALGAQATTVRKMFLRYGLVLATVGFGIGLLAAAGLSRLMATLLFGVSPLDPLSFAVAAFVLLAAVIGACYFPARRATAIDPIEVLRGD